MRAGSAKKVDYSYRTPLMKTPLLKTPKIKTEIEPTIKKGMKNNILNKQLVIKTPLQQENVYYR